MMRRAVVADAGAVKALADKTFGDPYIFLPEVQAYLEDPDDLCYLEEENGQLLAAILYHKESAEDIMENMGIPKRIYERIAGTRPCLHYRFIAVDEAAQHRGIAEKLMRETLRIIDREEKFGTIFTMFWVKEGEEIPMKALAKKFSYEPLHYLKRPWYKYADRACHLCGGRCKCDAFVYYRKVGATGIGENVRYLKITPENRWLFRELISPDYFDIPTEKDHFSIAAVTPTEETVYGVLLASRQEMLWKTEYLYVLPDYRRKGIGSGLLFELEKHCLKTQCEGIAARWYEKKTGIGTEFFSQNDELKGFFAHHGFGNGPEGNIVYEVPIAKAKDFTVPGESQSKGAAGLLTMLELPRKIRSPWLSRFGEELPPDLDPRNLEGELLPDHSLVYCVNDEVRAFMLVSRIKDNVILIGALYSEPAAGKVLPVMLGQGLRRIANDYPEAILRFCAATRDSKLLAAKLLAKYNQPVDAVCIREVYWNVIQSPLWSGMKSKDYS